MAAMMVMLIRKCITIVIYFFYAEWLSWPAPYPMPFVWMQHNGAGSKDAHTIQPYDIQGGCAAGKEITQIMEPPDKL